MRRTVYYLTGMGGRLDTGLGQGLLSRGCEISGRELVGEFRKLDFQEQIDHIVEDLRDNFWHEDARVIANSFGAYLFLHAQTQMPAYLGRLILLSPIVGEFGNEVTQMNFIPPRAEKLRQLAEAGTFPVPKQCQIHVGGDDWQSNPTNVKALGAMLGIDVTVVPNAGHIKFRESIQINDLETLYAALFFSDLLDYPRFALDVIRWFYVDSEPLIWISKASSEIAT